MCKAKNCKNLSEVWLIYIKTTKIQNGIIRIKFWKLVFHVVADLSLDAKLFFKNFWKFWNHSIGFLSPNANVGPWRLFWYSSHRSLLSQFINQLLERGQMQDLEAQALLDHLQGILEWLEMLGDSIQVEFLLD